MAQAGDGSLPKKLADAAEEKLRRSLDLLPQDSDAWYTLARVLSEQDRKDEAIEAYRRSLEIATDDADACYNLAVLVGDKGDVAEEKKLLLRVLQLKPDFGKAWANLGVALASTGDIDGAEQPFLNAVKFDPNAKNWLNLERVRGTKGRHSPTEPPRHISFSIIMGVMDIPSHQGEPLYIGVQRWALFGLLAAYGENQVQRAMQNASNAAISTPQTQDNTPIPASQQIVVLEDQQPTRQRSRVLSEDSRDEEPEGDGELSPTEN
ncbi:MAG: hypothetical protein SGPRY_002410 [Prymnesium sp.]